VFIKDPLNIRPEPFNCGKPHLHFQYLYGCTDVFICITLSYTIRKESETDPGTPFVKETGVLSGQVSDTLKDLNDWGVLIFQSIHKKSTQ
jgi:hypothetical protein